MIIYKCVITGDEMFSDIYKVTETDIFFEVEGKMVTRTEDFDESKIGANASAEESAETCQASSVSGVDIVLNHKLEESSFNKKSYLPYIKEYLKVIKKRLEENNPERVPCFTENCQKAVKQIVSQMDSWQFFTGESMNPDGMVALLNYREDGITPYMLFFKDGLEIEKC